MIERVVLLCFLIASVLRAEPLKVPKKYSCRQAIRADELLGNLPFICDINFRNISDVVIDHCTEWFDPSSVKQGDILYLGAWYLGWFVEHVHPRIAAPYILITCDVGNRLPPLITTPLLYDSKCAAWFGMNMIFSDHPKLKQIPMGQCLSQTGRGIDQRHIGEMREFHDKKPYLKQHLLYMNHFPRPLGDRDKIVRLFENAPFCFSRNRSDQPYVGSPDYLGELSASLFTLSPIGLETDCFRTWEALTVDCIPIVEHSFLDPLFEGMPVSFVHRWEEIDEAFLQKEGARLKDVKTNKYLFDPWAKAVKEIQQKVRKGDMHFSECEAMQWNDEDLNVLTDVLISLCSTPKAHVELLYKGYLSSIHALQLARELPNLRRIYLHDVMLNDSVWQHFDSLITQSCLLAMKDKITPLFSESAFDQKLIETSSKETLCFLDLTYFRYGLRSLEDVNNIRHSLKNDIQALYHSLAPAGTLCGNMIQNAYVQEVLASFAKEQTLVIENRGNFWWVRRKNNFP